MARVTHLNKSGSGFFSMTACGRNINRTPFSTDDWNEFKTDALKCTRCASSKFAAYRERLDNEASRWDFEPEPEDAWIAADMALIRKARGTI